MGQFAPLPALLVAVLALVCAGCGNDRPTAVAPAPGTTVIAPGPEAASADVQAALALEVPIPGVEGLRATASVPAGAGPFPLVIFSPGLGRSGNAYGFYADAWTNRGYACLRLSHPGSDIRIFADKAFWNLRSTGEKVARDPQEWQARVRDVRATIDALPGLAQRHAGLGRIDAGRIAVVGHSYGAFTALAVAGLRVNLPQRPAAELGDPRPLAFIAMAPPGPGDAIGDQAFAAIERPVLVLAGGNDTQEDMRGKEHPPAWRERPWQLMAPGGKWLLTIPDAHHFTFSDGGGRQKRADPAHLERISATSADFLDAYLKEDARAHDRLRAAGARSR
ncbi:MAG: hypothetical protein H0W72_10235 [Planctomycetes bacterium]|nr:hypothetical protein [Planctomycetota bacterium]